MSSGTSAGPLAAPPPALPTWPGLPRRARLGSRRGRLEGASGSCAALYDPASKVTQRPFCYPLSPLLPDPGRGREGHSPSAGRTCGMETAVAVFGKHGLSHCTSSVAQGSSHERSFDVPFAFFSHIWEIHVYQIAFLHQSLQRLVLQIGPRCSHHCWGGREQTEAPAPCTGSTQRQRLASLGWWGLGALHAHTQ